MRGDGRDPRSKIFIDPSKQIRIASRLSALPILTLIGATVAVAMLGSRVLNEARSLDAEQLASLACAPILLPGRSFGILYVDTRQPEARFSDMHVRLLSVVAAIAAAALARAQHLEQVDRERRRLHTAELRHDLVGGSKAMRDVHEFVARAAPTVARATATASGSGAAAAWGRGSMGRCLIFFRRQRSRQRFTMVRTSQASPPASSPGRRPGLRAARRKVS